MEFSIKSINPEKQRSDCLVIGVFEPRKLAVHSFEISKTARDYLAEILKAGDMEGLSGTSLLLHRVPDIAADRVLLVGLGKEKNFQKEGYTKALRTVWTALTTTGAEHIHVALADLALKGLDTQWNTRQAVVTLSEMGYRFDRFKTSSEAPPGSRLKKITLVLSREAKQDQAEHGRTEGLAIAEACHLARDLGNLPGNICTPSYLASQATALADTYGLNCEILEQNDLESLGMGAFLAVAKGSLQPPKFIILEYRGKGDAAPYVLVGKGITFDTGGISLKPGPEMDEMKFDMCGAAAVLATAQAVASLKLPINLTVLIPATENMPSGTATRPGDIVTSMSGQSIEILNTDAEGRLILCDALTYAERFKPKAVIDVATLTGACVIALGHVASGLFSKNDTLTQHLLNAGEISGDRAWAMPLWDDYQEQLKSPCADMANIGGRPAGSITAACFLARFTEKYDWAHIDIAGTAWKSGKEKGATGRPVPLLVQYLIQQGDRSKQK